MHESVYHLAVLWLAGLFAAHVIRAVRAEDLGARALRVDAASIVLVAVLLVQTLHTGQPHYLDAALVLALLSFVGTVVAGRFFDGGGLFS